MGVRREFARVNAITLGHGRQTTLGIVTIAVVIDVFDVDPTKTRLGDDRARRAELDLTG